MSTFKFWGESKTGEEGVSYRLREDGSYEVTYRKGKKVYTKIIPRPAARSTDYTDYSWRIEMKGPVVRSIFREGKGQQVEQVFDLTQEGMKEDHGRKSGAFVLLVIAVLFLLRFQLEIIEGIKALFR